MILFSYLAYAQIKVKFLDVIGYKTLNSKKKMPNNMNVHSWKHEYSKRLLVIGFKLMNDK
jgi:hypothetical protein